jgi:hypothetical protein
LIPVGVKSFEAVENGTRTQHHAGGEGNDAERALQVVQLEEEVVFGYNHASDRQDKIQKQMLFHA